MSGKKALPTDSDLAGVEATSKRAAKAALTLDRKTGTPFLVSVISSHVTTNPL
jgi:hypothetical protein